MNHFFIPCVSWGGRGMADYAGIDSVAGKVKL